MGSELLINRRYKGEVENVKEIIKKRIYKNYKKIYKKQSLARKRSVK